MHSPHNREALGIATENRIPPTVPSFRAFALTSPATCAGDAFRKLTAAVVLAKFKKCHVFPGTAGTGWRLVFFATASFSEITSLMFIPPAPTFNACSRRLRALPLPKYKFLILK